MEPIVINENVIEDDNVSIDVNISHILDKRLKDIEDCARVEQLREQYANSKSTQTDPPPKICQPFSIFRKFRLY